MAGADRHAVSAEMLVLGLLNERPDTLSGLTQRLGEEFASARFSSSTVYKAVQRMTLGGFARPIDRDAKRRVQRLRPTPEGVIEYGEWLDKKLTAPTSLRDPILVRLRVCRRVDHVRMVIALSRQEEIACERAQGEIRAELLALRRLPVPQESEPLGPDELSEEMCRELHCAALALEASLRANRVLALRDVRRKLERLLQPAEPTEGG